jgi:GDP-L-fucose synthase
MRKKVLVTGGGGLVGSSIERLAPDYEYDFIFTTRKDGDLCSESDVKNLLFKYKPNYVIHSAAKVGGIAGNLAAQADFFYQNLLMNAYMIHHSAVNNVEKFFAFTSVCVFPDGKEMEENNMHAGPPFQDNFAYAHAKRMVDVQIRAYKDQYKVKNYCSVIPGNIFGENDLFNLESGHVIPSLIHKLYIAKHNNEAFNIWGDGSAIREFLYVDDISKIILDLLGKEDIPERILISGEKQYSIKDIVETLCEVSNFKGEVLYDTSKPKGQAARKSNLTLLKSLFPDFKFTNLKESLKKSYEWFEENYPSVRL